MKLIKKSQNVMDQQTDQTTDQLMDGRTKRGVESRARD